ncbi:MAG: spermidine/putrescine ABC transporter substrate-binding protein, partial [Clostridia bacterium]|nr:spermidine/putrescine ABC transporter substrate-binding protein [Clostridia bacterium]
MRKTLVRRITSMTLLAVLVMGLALTGTGCSSKQKLYIFNWGDYIAPEILDLFEAEYPQYEVIYDNFDTNETMYQKLVSTNTPYDILVPSDYMIARLIEEDRLMKIDTSTIENYEHIRESLRGAAFDPKDEYSVPYLW